MRSDHKLGESGEQDNNYDGSIKKRRSSHEALMSGSPSQYNLDQLHHDGTRTISDV